MKTLYQRHAGSITVTVRAEPDPIRPDWDLSPERLDAYERDQWAMIGIVAVVTLDGADIGSSSLWGIEDDSGDRYLRSEARQIAGEAIADARAWIGRRYHA
jgi:hypothetical protein